MVLHDQQVSRRMAARVAALPADRPDRLMLPCLHQTAAGEIAGINAAFAALLGYASIAQLVALNAGRVENLYMNPAERGDLLRRLDEGAIHRGCEYALRGRQGTEVWVIDHPRRIGIGDGSIYESVLVDVTSYREREQQLLESENHYRLIAELAAEGVYVAKADVLSWVSDGFAELLGMARKDLIGKPLAALVAQQSWPAMQIERRARRSPRDGARFRVSLLRPGDQGGLPAEILERETRTPGGVVTIGVIRDLTKQLESEQSLAHDALHDPLTGLPNRRYFVEKLRERMEPVATSGRNPFAVLFIDLDNFKLVNDAHGHGAGDSFLLQVVERLRCSLREGDVLARHGGDEFTVLLAHVNGVDDVVATTARLQESLAAKPLLDELGIYASSSIGIVIDNPGYQTPEEMLRDADTAMYQAKAKGRASSAMFDETMLQAVRSRLILDSEVRHAHENGQFLNHYQPIFSPDGACIGAEALIRWQHPQRGLLAPAQFLNAVDESTVCIPIGRNVLFEACADLRFLLDANAANAAFSVSINVAERHLLSGALIADLAEALRRYRLDKSRIVLEIVETALARHPVIWEEIVRLKNAGFILSVDDFGVGTSSLSVIRDLPVDIVKIDRSFVDEIEGSPRNARFLTKILEIAHVLGLRTIGEGVQTQSQFEFLRDAGCCGMQGYLLAKPMDRLRLADFLASSRSASPRGVKGAR